VTDAVRAATLLTAAIAAATQLFLAILAKTAIILALGLATQFYVFVTTFTGVFAGCCNGLVSILQVLVSHWLNL
jgi:hypothetical protein